MNNSPGMKKLYIYENLWTICPLVLNTNFQEKNQ